MKRLAFLLLVMMAATPLRAGAVDGSETFYVQLIRGTDDVTPPTPDAQPAGPALCRRLQMFKWRYYWEVERHTVVLNAGGRSRQRIMPHREVEIALSTPGEMIVSIYADGKLTRRRTQAVESAFYIAGGDSEPAQSWFIVVRRDNPAGAQGNLE
jgi:hypothetical protein